MATDQPNDRAARYAAKLDPIAFFAWLLQQPRERIVFRRWQNVRNVPQPTAPDRIADAVAYLSDPDDGSPWAVIVEFKTTPELGSLGQTLAYQAQVWASERPDAESGSRFWVGTLIVNLTGAQSEYAQRQYRGTRMNSPTPPVIVNVATEEAAVFLDQIESEALSLALLPWMVLMRGGYTEPIIARWVRLALRETNSVRRSDYGMLALVFAAAANRSAPWQAALKEWNVEENTQVKLWQAAAEASGLQKGTLIGKIQVLQELLGEKVGTEAKLRSTSLKRLQEQLTQLQQRMPRPNAGN